jgi:hypothetical protein
LATAGTDTNYDAMPSFGTNIKFAKYLDWTATVNVKSVSVTGSRWDVHRALNNPAYALGRSMAEVVNIIGTCTPYPWVLTTSSYPFDNSVSPPSMTSNTVNTVTTYTSIPDLPSAFPYIPNRPPKNCSGGYIRNPNVTDINASNACMSATCSGYLSPDNNKCYGDCPSGYTTLNSTDTTCVPLCQANETATPTACTPICASNETTIGNKCYSCSGNDPGNIQYVFDSTISPKIFDSNCYLANPGNTITDQSWRDRALDHYMAIGYASKYKAGCDYKCFTQQPPNPNPNPGPFHTDIIPYGVFNEEEFGGSAYNVINQNAPDYFYWGASRGLSIIQTWFPGSYWASDFYPSRLGTLRNKSILADTNLTRRIYTKDPSIRTLNASYSRTPKPRPNTEIVFTSASAT